MLCFCSPHPGHPRFRFDPVAAAKLLRTNRMELLEVRHVVPTAARSGNQYGEPVGELLIRAL
jgi:hypothetical protein